MLSSDAIDIDILRGDNSVQQEVIVAIVIFATISAIMLLIAWIHYERTTKPREPLIVLIVPGALAGVVACIILFGGVAFPWITDTGRCEEQCLAEIVHAQTVIENSLYENYDVTTFTPQVADTGYSFDTGSEEGVWARAWILEALTSAPKDAPAADVQLPDGTLTVWTVTADPMTGEAQFFSSNDGPAPGSVARESSS